MLQWFQRLMPHQDVFFPAFERHAAVIVKAAMALRQMVVDGDQLKLRFEEILALEHEADSIARDVLLGLRTTFITPFDRDDIQSLIKKSLRKSRHCIHRVAERAFSYRASDWPGACEPSR